MFLTIKVQKVGKVRSSRVFNFVTSKRREIILINKFYNSYTNMQFCPNFYSAFWWSEWTHHEIKERKERWYWQRWKEHEDYSVGITLKGTVAYTLANNISLFPANFFPLKLHHFRIIFLFLPKEEKHAPKVNTSEKSAWIQAQIIGWEWLPVQSTTTHVDTSSRMGKPLCNSLYWSTLHPGQFS